MEQPVQDLFEHLNAEEAARELFDARVRERRRTITKTVAEALPGAAESKHGEDLPTPTAQDIVTVIEPLLTCVMYTPRGASWPSFINISHKDKTQLYEYVQEQISGRLQLYRDGMTRHGWFEVILFCRGHGEKRIWINGLSSKNRQALRKRLDRLVEPSRY